MERWREWTRLALFLSSLLMHSIIYRLRSIILSHNFHVRLEPMNEVDALVEEVLKESLLDVALIGKHFAVEYLDEDLPHPRVSVVHVCGS